MNFSNLEEMKKQRWMPIEVHNLLSTPPIRSGQRFHLRLICMSEKEWDAYPPANFPGKPWILQIILLACWRVNILRMTQIIVIIGQLIHGLSPQVSWFITRLTLVFGD
jgi:hypothetical protein